MIPNKCNPPSLRVQKYGGSSLSSPEKIRAIAQKVHQIHRGGQNVILVVSAMGHQTNELVALAHRVSPRPHPRELDMLLSSGERVCMALVCMALRDLDCPAISFTGSQAGILTTGNHSDAHILEIRPTRLQEELQKNKVVVLAGFQGVNPQNKEITTLGRGGSDTTAVAMAAHFQVPHCEVYKDVDGVYSADPKQFQGALHHPHLTYDQALSMSLQGGDFLHYKSIQYAKKHRVPIEVSASHFSGRSTWVGPPPGGGAGGFSLPPLTRESCALAMGFTRGVETNGEAREKVDGTGTMETSWELWILFQGSAPAREITVLRESLRKNSIHFELSKKPRVSLRGDLSVVSRGTPLCGDLLFLRVAPPDVKRSLELVHQCCFWTC